MPSPCPQLPGQQDTSPLGHSLQRMVAAMEAAILCSLERQVQGLRRLWKVLLEPQGGPKPWTQLPGMLVKAPRSTSGFVHPGKFGECSPSLLHRAPGKPPSAPFLALAPQSHLKDLMPQAGKLSSPGGQVCVKGGPDSWADRRPAVSRPGFGK